MAQGSLVCVCLSHPSAAFAAGTPERGYWLMLVLGRSNLHCRSGEQQRGIGGNWGRFIYHFCSGGSVSKSCILVFWEEKCLQIVCAEEKLVQLKILLFRVLQDFKKFMFF